MYVKNETAIRHFATSLTLGVFSPYRRNKIMIHENYERESHKLNTCNELSARDMLIDADRYEKRGEHNRARALRERADDLARDRDYTKGAYHYTHGWIIFV